MDGPRHTPAQLRRIADAIVDALPERQVVSGRPLANVVLQSGERLDFGTDRAPGLVLRYSFDERTTSRMLSRSRSVTRYAHRRLSSRAGGTGETADRQDWAYFEISLPLLLRMTLHELYRDAPPQVRGRAGQQERRLYRVVVETLGAEEARRLWPKGANRVPPPTATSTSAARAGRDIYRSGSSRDVPGGAAFLAMGLGGGGGC